MLPVTPWADVCPPALWYRVCYLNLLSHARRLSGCEGYAPAGRGRFCAFLHGRGAC